MQSENQRRLFGIFLLLINLVALFFLIEAYSGKEKTEYNELANQPQATSNQIADPTESSVDKEESATGGTKAIQEVTTIVNDLEDTSQTEQTLLVAPDKARFNPGVLITHVRDAGKKVALTFDSAWEFANTDQLLSLLRGYNIQSTFFLTGMWTERHPDLVEKILRDGHEVGNHSYSHPRFTEISHSELRNEVNKAQGVISQHTTYHTNLFRLPYGAANPDILETLGEMGYYVIGWSADSLDWMENMSAEDILKRIKQYHKDGGIILFHVGGFQTLVALPDIIEWYQDQGYEFVKVSDLIQR